MMRSLFRTALVLAGVALWASSAPAWFPSHHKGYGPVPVSSVGVYTVPATSYAVPVTYATTHAATYSYSYSAPAVTYSVPAFSYMAPSAYVAPTSYSDPIEAALDALGDAQDATDSARFAALRAIRALERRQADDATTLRMLKDYLYPSPEGPPMKKPG